MESESVLCADYHNKIKFLPDLQLVEQTSVLSTSSQLDEGLTGQSTQSLRNVLRY